MGSDDVLRDFDGWPQQWGDVRSFGPGTAEAKSATLITLRFKEPTPVAVMWSFSPGQQVTAEVIVCNPLGQMAQVPIPFPGATIYGSSITVTLHFQGGVTGLVSAQGTRLVR